MDGEPGTDTCSGGTPVDLAVCEHTHIPAVMKLVGRGGREYRPVEKTQFFLEGVTDGKGLGDGALDPPAEIDQLVVLFGDDAQAEVFCPAESVKGTAEGDITAYCADSWNIYLSVQGADIGRNIHE